MRTIKRLADKRPFVFALLILLIWLLLGAVLVVVCATLLQVSMTDIVPQMVGTLGATLLLLLLMGRMGWLGPIGITRLGSWRICLLTIPLLVCMVFAYWYGFFDDVSFDFGVLARSEDAQEILIRDGIVGFVEETLFRGIILYVLVRAWGKTRGGLIASVIVQAGLFAAIHVLQGMLGGSWGVVLMVMVNAVVSGIWWGAIVLKWKSLWPVIVLHGLSNASVLIKGLSSSYVEPAVAAYMRATLLEMPLLIFGVWLLLRTPTVVEVEEDRV
jgi:membrane protease YdiL (CAAX protease family)